jgi:hypothetical protein
MGLYREDACFYYMEKGNLWTVNKKCMKVESRKGVGCGGGVFVTEFCVFKFSSECEEPTLPATNSLKFCCFFYKKNKKFILYTVLPCLEPKGKDRALLWPE